MTAWAHIENIAIVSAVTCALIFAPFPWSLFTLLFLVWMNSPGKRT